MSPPEQPGAQIGDQGRGVAAPAELGRRVDRADPDARRRRATEAGPGHGPHLVLPEPEPRALDAETALEGAFQPPEGVVRIGDRLGDERSEPVEDEPRIPWA